MSTWAAIAAREAAITTSAGATALHGIAPSALDGFAVGALLTGVCFLIIIAPRAFRRERLSARAGMWSGGLRHSRVRRDYYAAAAETYSPGPAETYTPADAAGPAETFGLTESFGPAATYTPAENYGPAGTYAFSGGAAETAVAGLAAEDVFLVQTDPAPGAYSAAASRDFAGHAGADPYADPFGSSSDDDIVLPGDDPGQDDNGRRGYRSKHRMTGQDGQDRRPEQRRGPPRHAAPSSRFGSRMSSRISMFPLAPARG